ncbi:OB-fold domain-containing protein [Streptomyces ipomoeae]|uniref:OB-fold domain-containing protein n=1 Tax=Streptomyces ipomoeae TaxID=103232 RepID=UPI0011477EB1|nr:OB-fold domain-containing protein [Streptomyces ipomoeae]TQE30003.1 protein dehydratase [Streptomyces ipomoeae]
MVTEGELSVRLKAYEGRAAVVGGVGKDPVNAPMIRHWCEAMGDTNPAYTGPDAIAPPTMLQAWTMGGLSGHESGRSRPSGRSEGSGRSQGSGRSAAYEELLALLDDAGCTSVVATDCEQEYLRVLRPGDEIAFDSVVESVSERKNTRLGAGYFVTTRMDVRVGDELVGTHRFRIFKYAPAAARSGAAGGDSKRQNAERQDAESQGPARQAPKRRDAESQDSERQGPARQAPERQGPERQAPARQAPERQDAASQGPERQDPEKQDPEKQDPRQEPKPRRPRPVVNRDNAGFWEGVARHELLIQRCTDCATLRFPWLPGCNACGSAEWDTVRASGEGIVHSYVVMHHPPFPAFDPPYAVGLVELTEGVRIVSNVVGVPYDKVRIGMAVRLEFVRYDEELELPVFRADDAEEVGDGLPPLRIPITRTLVVAGAIASRDYQDVHHDPELARRRGSPDIFMNILTTNGLVGRYITDHFGPGAVLRKVAIRLGAPNYPGDTMVLTGTIEAIDGDTATVKVVGDNGIGRHVTGTVTVTVPKPLASPAPVTLSEGALR